MFHCGEVGAIDAYLKRTARFSWRVLVQYLNLFKAGGEAEVLDGIEEVVDDVL